LGQFHRRPAELLRCTRPLQDEFRTMPSPETAQGDTPTDDSEKTQAKGGALRQEELMKIYAGADGQLDEIDKMMMKYDADCSGCFSIAEVKSIIHDLEASKQNTKNLARALGLTIIIALVVIGALIGLMIMSIEVTKENHTEEGTIVGLDGGVVSVGQAEAVSSIYDLPKMEVEDLANMKSISFAVDMSADPNLGNSGGSSESLATFAVAGAVKANDDDNIVTIYLTSGDRAVIDRVKRAGYLRTPSGATHPFIDADSGRRLQDMEDWLSCKGEEGTCKPKPSRAYRRKMAQKMHERRLRRGGFIMSGVTTFSQHATNAGGNQ